MDVELSNGKRVDLPEHDEFYQLLTQSSAGLIEDDEQHALRHARLLIAGCGAVGANVAVNLVRAGGEHLTLVDPKTCDLAHLSRMAIDLRALDRNRAEVIAERVHDINPYAAVTVIDEPITETSCGELLHEIDIAIDTLGIETNGDLQARFALHSAAKARHIPVISGFDVATSGWVLVYDYRNDDQQVLDGSYCADNLDPAEAADQIEILTRMISLSQVPIEMIREAERILTGQSDQLPRLGFSGQLTSAIICHTLLDVLFERPVRRAISLDLASAVRPPAATLKLAGRRLVELYGLRRQLRERRRRNRVGVFSPLDDEVFKELRPYMEERVYETGSVIIRQGDTADEFFVIVDGQVTVEHEEHRFSPDGQEEESEFTVIAELGPGDYFGEMALLTDSPRAASVVVKERCTLLVLSRGAFEMYLEESRLAAKRVAHAALSRRRANELLGA